MIAEGGMTYAEVGSLTFPQLLCRFSDKPPETSRRITSFEEFEAFEREREAAWRAPA